MHHVPFQLCPSSFDGNRGKGRTGEIFYNFSHRLTNSGSTCLTLGGSCIEGVQDMKQSGIRAEVTDLLGNVTVPHLVKRLRFEVVHSHFRRSLFHSPDCPLIHTLPGYCRIRSACQIQIHTH
jgi:hypothetical protein